MSLIFGYNKYINKNYFFNNICKNEISKNNNNSNNSLNLNCLNKQKKIIIIFTLIIINFIIYNRYKKIIRHSNYKYYKKKNIKVCLCTPCKNENRYIREYVEYYKRYGIDKIFLYDNNDINGEKLEDSIADYINTSFVKVFNWRGKKKQVFKIMNDCYKRTFNKFDWIIFYEVDEYIYLKNIKNIKVYLNRDTFKNCQTIRLNWVHHTDNNLIYYDNRTLHERFPEVEPNAKMNIKGSRNSVKSILRGNIPNITINNIHMLNINLKGCNGFGKIQIINDINAIDTNDSDFRNYYIDHFYSKSLEEFIEKINKGDVAHEQAIWLKKFRIRNYFERNNITLEKLNFIEKYTKLNLSYYKKKLKNIN